MIGIAIAVIAVLCLIAALHLYWGVGGLWPGKDGPDLSSRVAGTRSKRPAGFGPCAAVAALLLAAAYVIGATSLIFPQSHGASPAWPVEQRYLHDGHSAC